MKKRIDSIAKQLKIMIPFAPEIGIVLGTGLETLIDFIQIHSTIPYSDIEGFPKSTVDFHKGQLIIGELSGKKIIAMQGRFHFYEGYTASELVIPIRVMHQLGIKQLIVSNAAGNLNTNWKKGELMLITDHINLLPDNPLRGSDARAFGEIFLDMSQPYDFSMNQFFIKTAQNLDINIRQGVYAAVAGPNLETKAEYRFLRTIGADAVGMSTVPEVIAANQLGIPVLAVSVLTDDCDPDHLQPVNISEILAVAKIAEKDLNRIMIDFLKSNA